MVIRNSENIIIEGSTFYGLGGQAVRIIGGRNNAILSSDIFNIGRGGIRMSGGDRITLTPGGHLVENTDIWNFCFDSSVSAPAIEFTGVGHAARHNRIHNGPHVAITFGGNNHLIEYNEIFDMVNNTSDAGAIYGGRDWTQAGTIIRNNFFHDIWGRYLGGRYDAHAVYFDDMVSGNYVYGNIFYEVFSAVFLHGSRNTTVNDNIIINSPRGIWLRNMLRFNTIGTTEEQPHYLRWNFRQIFTFDQDDPTRTATPASEAWHRFGRDVQPPENHPFFNLYDFPYFRRMDMIPWDQPQFPKYNEFTRNVMYNSGAQDPNFAGRFDLDSRNMARPGTNNQTPPQYRWWNYPNLGQPLATQSGYFEGNEWRTTFNGDVREMARERGIGLYIDNWRRNVE